MLSESWLYFQPPSQSLEKEGLLIAFILYGWVNIKKKLHIEQNCCKREGMVEVSSLFVGVWKTDS